jgi:hypothetical protein
MVLITSRPLSSGTQVALSPRREEKLMNTNPIKEGRASCALLSSMALAGNGQQKGKTTQQQVGNKANAGVCPYGNTPQGGKAQGKASGYGPGNGTGNAGNGPKDGSGYGKTKNPNATGVCDGTGPKGKAARGQKTTRGGRQR